jgi:putative phosphoesterase
MKRLVLISDTHMRGTPTLPAVLVAAIEAADLVVHAGDFATLEMYEWLAARKPVLCARGNMDEARLAVRLPEVGEEVVLGHRIGVIHGWGAPRGLVERIADHIDPTRYALVVFGHSHYPEIRGFAGTLWVNPGSPVDRRFAPYNTYATVTVTEEGVGVPEIVKL